MEETWSRNLMNVLTTAVTEFEYIAGTAILGIAGIGAVLRFGQGAEIITWRSNFILMALSGAFNPVESPPPALRPVSKVLPSTQAFDAMRQVLAGKPLPTHSILTGLIGSVFFVVGGSRSRG